MFAARPTFFALLAPLFLFATPAFAQVKETLLYTFDVNSSGSNPSTGLLAGPENTYYGMTSSGGTGCVSGCGVFYKLARQGTSWKETVLYEFHGNDGYGPMGNLIADKDGNIYGATEAGGGSSCDGGSGCGVVYKLSPPPEANGPWKETVLYAFQGGSDGAFPTGLYRDAAGNLFGTTYAGGASTNCENAGCGTVFELSPSANGSWTKKILYSFNGGSDGQYPQAPPIAYNGVFYGTTSGQNYNWGTVFSLTHTGGTWQEKVLYTFAGGTDGAYPATALYRDADGNLLGTTLYGGVEVDCGSGCGTVFELSPSGNGQWTETIVHRFWQGGGADGIFPSGPFTADENGTLYSTTTDGTSDNDAFGTVYELNKINGTWVYQTLYGFAGPPGNGNPAEPEGGVLVKDGGHHLFGASMFTTDNEFGAIYELQK